MSKGPLLVNFQKDGFSDSADFEASNEGVQLRYIRTAHAKDFVGYGEFLLASNLPGILDEIRPFAETFNTFKPGIARPR